MSNIDSILQLIKQASSTKNLKIWLPSIKKEVEFAPLTISQQKRLVHVSINSPDSTMLVDLDKTFYNILEENILDKNILIKDLVILDKDIIILEYRNSIKPFIKDKNTDSISLDTFISNYRQCTDYSNVTIVEDNMKLEVGLPTLHAEKRYTISEVYDTNSPEEKATHILNMITLDVVKSVKRITIGELSVTLDEIDVDQVNILLESLPYTITNRIYESLLSLRNARSKLWVNSENGTTIRVDVSLLVDL